MRESWTERRHCIRDGKCSKPQGYRCNPGCSAPRARGPLYPKLRVPVHDEMRRQRGRASFGIRHPSRVLEWVGKASPERWLRHVGGRSGSPFWRLGR